MLLFILWIAWAGLNLVTFLLYGLDKLKAKRGKWRIPERTLLLFTWLLGGLGAFAGMRVFRHKTKHLVFQVSAAAGMALSLAAMAALTYVLTLA